MAGFDSPDWPAQEFADVNIEVMAQEVRDECFSGLYAAMGGIILGPSIKYFNLPPTFSPDGYDRRALVKVLKPLKYVRVTVNTDQIFGNFDKDKTVLGDVVIDDFFIGLEDGSFKSLQTTLPVVNRIEFNKERGQGPWLAMAQSSCREENGPAPLQVFQSNVYEYTVQKRQPDSAEAQIGEVLRIQKYFTWFTDVFEQKVAPRYETVS